ncbi:MAG TPA: serine hydrolase [Anaerolineales bacterium]|nr:serine hydrolase [Anaerolineales bacterium]
MIAAARVICFTMLLSAFSARAAAEDFTDAIRAFLERRVEVEKRDVGIVVGIVDEHGSRIVSCGKMDNGTDQEVNGDTLFDIASITKPFTGLLLQDMIERREMKLDDPVAKYMPKSVKMPTHNGKQITLRHLAMHTSGLPHFAGNLNPKRVDQPFANYTVDELNAFLAGYQLTHDPGTKFEYSSLGAGLLGHVIALKAGSDYESLVVDRICRPLRMDSTRITLTPELKARFATGHNQFGEAVPSWERQTQLGGSALRSTANDMLKFVSANLGFTPSSLTPIMEKTHTLRLDQTLGMDLGLAWIITRWPQEREIIWHAGGAPGYVTFAAFDKARRRGVVILSSSWDLDVVTMGFLLLGSEWQPDKRPKETKISSQIYDSSVGQYELSPSFSLGAFAWRMLLLHIPKAVIYIPVGLSLALLFILLRRATTVRKRWIIVGSSALVTGLLMLFVVLASSHVVCALCHPTLGIRREGDRLFVQYDLRLAPVTGKFITPAQAKALPQITGELLAESETRCFTRTIGIPMTFSCDDQGKVTCATAHFLGTTFSHEKISDQPPECYAAPKPRVAIKLETKLLDACVGDFEFAPSKAFPTGIKATIRREGDQLLWQARGEKVIPGPFNVDAASETNFFIKVHGPQLTFIKNDKSEVTAVSFCDDAWLPDGVGKKNGN